MLFQSSQIIFSSIFLLLFIIGNSSQEDLNLTKSQKSKLEKFKHGVSNIKFPHEWMRDELNLLRYLRTRKWDEQRAKDMITETIKWWKASNMDNIHKEDWSSYEKDYPIYLDGVDKNGQPIFAYAIGEWDLRQAVVQGRLKGVIRWMFKRRDEIHAKVRELQRQGQINGTQWNLVVNLDKFNSKQHLCAQCLRLYTDWVTTLEAHYPSSQDKIFVINSPSTFQVVMNLIRPLLTPSTRNAIKILGTNMNEWSNTLFAEIARDQLPEGFGGTRNYTLHF